MKNGGMRSKRKPTTMMPSELRERIERLRPASEQRERLLGWLDEYNSAGFYNRKGLEHSAEFAYNHLQNAPWLLWLAQAVGTPEFALRKARASLVQASPGTGSQAAAVREVLPWALIEALLRARAP